MKLLHLRDIECRFSGVYQPEELERLYRSKGLMDLIEQIDVIKHAKCWIKPDVESAAKACVQRNFNKQVMAQIVRSGDIQQVCPHVYKSLTCAGDVVYNNCGKEAAAVYTTISAYDQLMIAQIVSCPEIKNTFGSASNNPYKTGNGPLGTSDSTRNSLHIPVVGMTALVTLLKYVV